MATIPGIRSLEGARDRVTDIDIAGVPLRVAALGDIIKSERARRPSQGSGRAGGVGDCA